MTIGDFIGKMWNYVTSQPQTETEKHIGRIRDLSRLDNTAFQQNLKELSQSIHAVFTEVESNRHQVTSEEHETFQKLAEKLKANPVIKKALLRELGALSRAYNASPFEALLPEIRSEIISKLPIDERGRLKQVSRSMEADYQVGKAQKALAGTISRNAIHDTLEEKKPLKGLFEDLRVELRNSVRTLDLKGITALTPADLRTIAALFPNIATLRLGNTPLTKEHLLELAKFTNLRHLELVDADLGDDCFEVLQHLKELESLDLSDNLKIRGDKLELAPSSLKELIFDRSHVKEDNIPKLERLDKLEKLTMNRNELQGSSFAHLPASLIDLSCIDSLLDDRAISHISHLTKLQRLDISGNFCEGTTLDQLPPTVTELVAHRCPLLPEMIQRARKDLHIFP